MLLYNSTGSLVGFRVLGFVGGLDEISSENDTLARVHVSARPAGANSQLLTYVSVGPALRHASIRIQT